MPFTSKLVSIAIDPAAPNHPLSFFEPDRNGTWADGQWRIAGGTYNLHVGTSSADTPLQAAVNLCPVSVGSGLEGVESSGRTLSKLNPIVLAGRSWRFARRAQDMRHVSGAAVLLLDVGPPFTRAKHLRRKT